MTASAAEKWLPRIHPIPAVCIYLYICMCRHPTAGHHLSANQRSGLCMGWHCFWTRRVSLCSCGHGSSSRTCCSPYAVCFQHTTLQCCIRQHHPASTATCGAAAGSMVGADASHDSQMCNAHAPLQLEVGPIQQAEAVHVKKVGPGRMLDGILCVDRTRQLCSMAALTITTGSLDM